MLLEALTWQDLTRLLTTEALCTGLALLHPPSAAPVIQQGAPNKIPHHRLCFHQVPLAFLAFQAGVALSPETEVPRPP